MAGRDMHGNEQVAALEQAPEESDVIGGEHTPQQSVVDAISTGDHRTALMLCARFYGKDIGRLCMAILGSQAEADDATQETLLAAHDSFGGYRGDGSLLAWLCGIARRRCARHVERSGRRAAILHLVTAESTPPPGDDLLMRRQQAEQARAALSTLRPSDREALILRYVSGLSYRDIGTACKIEETTARQRVSRALSRLRDALAKEERHHG